jgi:hypothetical protein
VRTIGATYLTVGAVLAGFLATLVAVIGTTSVSSSTNPSASSLIQPIVALVILTGIVWVMMVVYRNVAVIRGAASVRYFQSYTAEAPAEWVERPARAYMNLLELPVLFYVVCLLMLATGRFDAVQVSLAWLFILIRYAHAIVHIGFNYVPLRFAAFASGAITLGILWARFASLNLQ